MKDYDKTSDLLEKLIPELNEMERKMKQTAAENFLTSLDTELPIWMHMENLKNDARSYKWDNDTILAIQIGIKKAYKKGE